MKTKCCPQANRVRINGFVDAVAVNTHVLFGKIHKNATIVFLNDTILQASIDAQFNFFHIEHKLRLDFARNVCLGQIEKFHQTLNCRPDNGRASSQSNLGLP